MKHAIKIILYGSFLMGLLFLFNKWDVNVGWSVFIAAVLTFLIYMLAAVDSTTKDPRHWEEADKAAKLLPNMTVIWMGRTQQYIVSCEFQEDHAVTYHHQHLDEAILGCLAEYTYYSELDTE